MTAPGPDVLPRRFGRYQLFDRIGKGGMAEIFLARAQLEVGITRLVVVKQIHAHLSRDPVFSRAFVEEAKLSAGLRHANIAQVVDLGRSDPDDGGLLYMAMEYVEGLDLSQLLRRLSQKRVPMALEHGLLIVREVLTALDVAHRASQETGPDAGKPLGLVHRDVSPSNVLLTFDGEVKLCDFGIAKAMNQDANRENDRGEPRVVGKSAYMSPEHARGEPLDARADVFAAGILLWELCAGRRLYKGSESEMLELARRAEVPPLPGALPHHDALQAILSKALAPDREARFASARAFRDALEAWAVEARLVLSPIRFGAFLEDNIGLDEVAARRARERAAAALEKGPPVILEPLRSSRPSIPTPITASAEHAITDSTDPSAPASGAIRLAAAEPERAPSPRASLPSVPAEAFAKPATADKRASRRGLWIALVLATAAAAAVAAWLLMR